MRGDGVRASVLHGHPFAKNTQFLGSTDRVRSSVATNPRAIGYGVIARETKAHASEFKD